MEKNKKYNLERIDFRQEPILPVFSEPFTRSAWVSYGENNNMPQFLIDQYNNCSIHKAIIKSKQIQVIGDGIVSQNNPLATINLLNGKENVEDIYRKCALDLILFGGYALNIIKARDGSIAEIYHLDFSRVRVGKTDKETEEIEKYYYSPDWNNLRKFPAEEFDVFNMDTKSPSQILYYKEYSPNNEYYPIPDYSGALAAIQIDVNIKEFHNNNLKNGMLPSLWIDFLNGVPSPEEVKIITRGLEEQFSSVNNAGRPIISFSENPDLAPKITQMPASSNDGYYTAIYEDIVRSILSAHRVSSGELYGISSAGKLGSSQEILDHSEYFRKMVVIPYQKELLPTFEKLLSIKFEKPTRLEVLPLTIFKAAEIKDPTNTQI